MDNITIIYAEVNHSAVYVNGQRLVADKDLQIGYVLEKLGYPVTIQSLTEEDYYKSVGELNGYPDTIEELNVLIEE